MKEKARKTESDFFSERKISSQRIHGKARFGQEKEEKKFTEDILKLNKTRKVSFGRSYFDEMSKERLPVTERVRSNSFYPDFTFNQEPFKLKKESYLYQGLKKNKNKQQRSTDLEKQETPDV